MPNRFITAWAFCGACSLSVETKRAKTSRGLVVGLGDELCLGHRLAGRERLDPLGPEIEIGGFVVVRSRRALQPRIGEVGGGIHRRPLGGIRGDDRDVVAAAELDELGDGKALVAHLDGVPDALDPIGGEVRVLEAIVLFGELNGRRPAFSAAA